MLTHHPDDGLFPCSYTVNCRKNIFTSIYLTTQISDFKKKNPKLDQDSNFGLPDSYPGSIYSTGLNLSSESNSIQVALARHHLSSELNSSLFLYTDVLNQIDKEILTYNVCLDKLKF